jgi:hypothetical protein
MGVPLGSSVIIRGTVTDVSPGTQDIALTTRFPNGVPAVSDASMSDWMLYVYKQFPCPDNAQGVPVRIDVLDSNNNYRNIGTTTSDASGFFSFAWKPDIPGKFTVYAYFEGSESYYGSYAETAFVVDEAAPTTPIEPEPPTEQPTEPEPEAPFITTEVAVIVAVVVIAVVAVAAYWVLRRRQ